MNSTNPMGPNQMGINQMGKTTTTNARRPEPAQVAAAARVSLARWLATGRHSKNLSIEDIARVTKIPPRTLDRLEAGSHEGLPAEVFVKGFVRSFARAVGLDEQEALLRFSACGVNAASVPTAAARALVESMAELAPIAAAKPAPTLLQPQRDVPSSVGPVATPVATLAPMMLGALPSDAPIAESGMAQVVSEVVAFSASSAISSDETVAIVAVEPVLAAGSSAMIAVDAIAVAASVDDSSLVAAVVDINGAKKKTRAPRKKKPTKRELLAAQASSVAATVTEGDVLAVVSDADAVVLQTMVVDASSGVAHVAHVAHVATVPLVEADQHETQDAGATAPQRIEVIDGVLDGVDSNSGTDSVAVASHDVWVPKMPALAIPWTRPTMTAPMLPLIPTLVIDDSDPESAERELAAERDDAKAPRRSLIPSILLENDDRGRQGGLTLAVIILLIAATLTLSYLMRRPGAGGDGMTQHRSTPTAPLMLVG